MFDLRNLEHSTIIYESPDGEFQMGPTKADKAQGPTPLLRVAWNKQDPNYLATIPMDSNELVILDIRVPSLPCAKLKGHSQCVNSVAWAPHSSCHLGTAGDDGLALIWDISHLPKPIDSPLLAYEAGQGKAGNEIDMLQWSRTQPDFIAITFDKKLQILRV